MKNLRKYGKPPFKVAVIHGGPGAPGSIAPVGRELSKTMSVLEPLQTKDSLEGQIEELCEVLEKNADIPAVLVGHSWGAWLAYFIAARYPQLVKKLILVGSGAYEEKYANNILPDRLNRLSEAERIEIFKLNERIYTSADREKNKALARLGELFAKADTYDALPHEPEPEPLEASVEINSKVWAEALELRINGELLKLGKRIKCPVVAIHGDYDPHLAEGVEVPLSRSVRDFKFILLEKCGHEPWTERYARDRFFKILKQELE
jgi:pimeloyl-ACP methyl ester carboxylesterase